ncbi:MAG: hypothetical protein ACOC80_12450, partial [Petrotogales bacterium]
VYVYNSYEECKTWAILVEETYFYIMIENDFVYNLSRFSECNHLTLIGKIDTIDDIYVIHVKKINKFP